MASFFSFLTTKKFPAPKKIRSLLRGPVTPFVAVVYGIFFALCLAVFLLLITINKRYLTTVPARGGNLTEGVIGAPHSINPLLAATATDQRLVALIYGTLTKMTQDYTVSPDGTKYAFTLLPNLSFDDGKPLTSDDVAFTVTKLQNSAMSDQSSYWQSISVETPDAQTVIFSLPAPDTTFLSHAAFGILPKHVWQNVADESFQTAPQNLRPVGAGPMKLSAIHYQNGIPFSVVLKRNKHSASGETLLDSITIKSYANQIALLEAINNGDVDFSYAATPDALAATALNPDLVALSVPTSHTVTIYRSSHDTALSSGTAVSTLSQLIDKNAIIATVQHGYGTPQGVLKSTTVQGAAQTAASLKGFALAVENDPVLMLAAQTMAQQLAQHGVSVTVNAFDPGTFQKNISTGTFPLFLARDDQTIPSQYASAVPLYAESLPYIFNTSTHTIPPETFQSPAIEYETVQHWYTNTDKLWKWFIKKN